VRKEVDKGTFPLIIQKLPTTGNPGEGGEDFTLFFNSPVKSPNQPNGGGRKDQKQVERAEAHADSAVLSLTAWKNANGKKGSENLGCTVWSKGGERKSTTPT